ncbi:hypothetical protein J6590_011316, partial [Homalodisca vitripennis]
MLAEVEGSITVQCCNIVLRRVADIIMYFRVVGLIIISDPTLENYRSEMPLDISASFGGIPRFCWKKKTG